jgi:hypothetical protein
MRFEIASSLFLFEGKSKAQKVPTPRLLDMASGYRACTWNTII